MCESMGECECLITGEAISMWDETISIAAVAMGGEAINIAARNVGR